MTAPRDTETGCVHSPAWYVQRLTARLSKVAEEQPASVLPEALAEAIEQVRGDHEGRCDLDNPATPAATVCLLRPGGDKLDYLILADCTLVADQCEAVTVMTDQRFGDAVAELRRKALTTKRPTDTFGLRFRSGGIVARSRT